jgi:hypothetical protein
MYCRQSPRVHSDRQPLDIDTQGKELWHSRESDSSNDGQEADELHHAKLGTEEQDRDEDGE